MTWKGWEMTVRVCVIVKSVTYSGSKISSKERRNEKEREISYEFV